MNNQHEKINIGSIIFCIAIFIVGVLTGASDFKSMFTDIKWTDIGIFILSCIGFIVGFYNYFLWVKSKANDESYAAAKRYLSAIDNIEKHLNDLAYQYSFICPIAGNSIEPIELSNQRLILIKNIIHEFYQSRVELHKSKRDLRFWRVSLTDSFTQTHESLVNKTDNFAFVAEVLTSELHVFINQEMKNINSVDKLTQQMDSSIKEIYKLFIHRTTLSFFKIFELSLQN